MALLTAEGMKRLQQRLLGAGKMDEVPKSIEIEINAPPQEAQEAVFTGTPQIAGETATPQVGGEIPLSDNVVYSMGPDGQLIAIEKPPFSWKQFGIGAGIPSLLLLLPILLLIATTSPYAFCVGLIDLTLPTNEPNFAVAMFASRGRHAFKRCKITVLSSTTSTESVAAEKNPLEVEKKSGSNTLSIVHLTSSALNAVPS